MPVYRVGRVCLQIRHLKIKEGFYMARAPFQILVFPFIKTTERRLEYAIFKRADAEYWQGIAGGGEDNEKPLDAARRETLEEAGIAPKTEFILLDLIEPIPVLSTFGEYLWGEDVKDVPQYAYGVEVFEKRFVLSPEHTEYRWVSIEEALHLLYWPGNKTVLKELHGRLTVR